LNARDWEKEKERIDRIFERVEKMRFERLEIACLYSNEPGRRAEERKARRKRQREKKKRLEFNLKYYDSPKVPLVIDTSTAEFIEGARLLTGQNLYKTCGDILAMFEELAEYYPENMVTLEFDYLRTFRVIRDVKAVRGYAKRFGCLDFVELELRGRSKVIGHKNPS
jgi:hypothetical protein